jgi:hypothetical protein
MDKSSCRQYVGAWIEKNGTVVGNDQCEIIDHLVKHHLQRVGEREDGWTILYLDPRDDTFWERTYPQGEMHGGGPPTLTELSEEEVQSLYGTVPSQRQ